MSNRRVNFAERFASSRMQAKVARMRNSFTMAIVLGAVALPIMLLASGHAGADTPPVAKSTTLEEVTHHGVILTAGGMDFDVVYTPDRKFSTMGGAVTGAWRIDGDKLCVTTAVQSQESCPVYPPGKKSGDSFELMTDQGPVQIRIK